MFCVAFQSFTSSKQVSINEHSSKVGDGSGPVCQEEEGEEDDEEALWGSMQTVTEPAKKVRKRGPLSTNKGMTAEPSTGLARRVDTNDTSVYNRHAILVYAGEDALVEKLDRPKQKHKKLSKNV